MLSALTIQRRPDKEDRWLEGRGKEPKTEDLGSGPGSPLMHCLAWGGGRSLPFGNRVKLNFGDS